MTEQGISRQDDRFVREYDYGDARVIAIDMETTDGSVDVVDDTVIVVGNDGSQFEMDLPTGQDAQAFINNGVLTIEVNR